MTRDGYYDKIRVELTTREREVILKALLTHRAYLSKQLNNTRDEDREGQLTDERDECWEIEDNLKKERVYEVKA